MPMFGKRDHGEEVAAHAEVDRLQALPPPELAVEIMCEFAPDGPWDGASPVTQTTLVQWAGGGMRGSERRDLEAPILEAMQLLEHAELVYVRQISHVNGERGWCATRFGLATLANGNDAVRQRIQDRTGL